MARDDAPWKPSNLAKAARIGELVERITHPIAKRTYRKGFPYLPPTIPLGVEVPEDEPTLGADYDTDWARKSPAKFVRKGLVNGPIRLAVKGLASPKVYGVDRLHDLAQLKDPPPLIFTPNHHSHLDTAVMAVAVPEPWRSKLVVAAAADYFFDKRWKATMAALALNAIPIPEIPYPLNGRIAPHELTVYRIRAVVLEILTESDGDWHLILGDPKNLQVKIIAEIPSPDCAATERHRELYTSARAVLRSIPRQGEIEIEGVGFFDFIHNQRGRARNGFELHPVLHIRR